MPYPASTRPALQPCTRRLSPCAVLVAALVASHGVLAQPLTTPDHAASALVPGEALAVPAQPRAAAMRPAPGLEINYDLLAEPGAATGPGRLEGVVAGSHGRLLTSVLLNPGGLEGERLARLDTAWFGPGSAPLPALVLGDTFGSGGGWSRPVRFGGLRFGRSVMVRPGYVTAPQPVWGTAALPSSLEAAGVQEAPAGGVAPPPAAFALSSGAGQPQIALPATGMPAVAGRQPAVGTPGSLETGASDYEVEAGRLRSGWGTVDDRYDQGYAAGAYRRGLGAGFTAEARGEWTPARIAGGVEMSSVLGPAGTVRAVLAQSSTPEQSGLRWGMGYMGKAEGMGWSLSWDEFERGFTQLGAAPGEAPPRGRMQAGAQAPLWGKATASLSYTHQRSWDAPAAAVLGLAANVPLPLHSHVAFHYTLRPGAQQTTAWHPAWQAGMTLSVPLSVMGPGS
ncbi:hypothetical protein [Ramlibacter tataouinensis]|uniref:Uncharacterized protein n=1 Tax=Ramlibacter tataouinensis (strain ATCC BAA-407 / DSM 14655 / LMG 21543 / TTB310) TaxID=365046 RepID=F5Y685_RAMTT|nr:hypothetical protein [Ramlibacter tataouinensis]AEG92771.1 hypothetical protein Rta_16790 [Ramlibacter tataouinensis TTB310]